MFSDNSNLIQLDKINAPKIYVYPNFFSQQECDDLILKINKFPEDHWINKDIWKEDDEILATKLIIQGSDDLDELYNRAFKFFEPEHRPLPANGVSKMVEGQSLEVHFDSPNHEDDQREHNGHFISYQEQIDKGNFYDPLGTCHTVDYGFIIYLSDFEGGDIYYPELGVEYKPNKGDMVIHSAGMRYQHGVHKVTKGPRICYANFIVKNEIGVIDLNEYKKEENETQKFSKEAIVKKSYPIFSK